MTVCSLMRAWEDYLRDRRRTKTLRRELSSAGFDIPKGAKVYRIELYPSKQYANVVIEERRGSKFGRIFSI